VRNPTYPLTLPPDLLKEIRKTAKETGLSLAEAMRQSIKLGAPKLRQDLARESSILKGLKPLTKAQARRLYSRPNPEFDALERHMANPVGLTPIRL
jgi:hypothetical protein